MENQNSSEQGNPVTRKRFNLKGKRKCILMGIAILLLGSCVARGAGMRGAHVMGNTGWDRVSVLLSGGNTTYTQMEFEAMGVVFAESTATGRDGYGLTYNALMREAVAKGADGIINVSIHQTGGVFNRTWSGSALAIKYLNTVQ